MKLLFYDKFFDSLIKLPKGTQKKVIDFQKKFREDSRSSGIHLEPISTFRDRSLRSARVDQTYRAIIKAPESGDIFYLLWVDTHDEAYKWATNKIFQWNDETQSMQVFSAPDETFKIQSDSQHQKIQNKPFFSKIDQSKLLKIGVPAVLLPSIVNIDTLVDLEDVENFIPVEVFENLFYLLDGADIDNLIFEIEEGKVKEKEFEAKVASINNQRNFIELTDDTLFNEILSGGLNIWKYYLHPSQRKLVSTTFNGSAKVSGGAGTGKTVAALHRLKYLSQIKHPSEKILFTTFTKALTENIRCLVKGLDIEENKITVTNIDKLVKDLVAEYNVLEEGYKIFEFDPVKSPEELWEDILSSELTPYSPDFLEAEYKEVILYHNVASLNEYIRTSRKGRGKPISRRQRAEMWDYFEKFREQKKQKLFYYKDEVFNALNRFLIQNKTKPFDYCLVDELQDFSNVELRLIRSLVPEKPNDLFMVGDPLQKIYDRTINFSSIGINIRGKRSKRLRINYRTTEEIKKLALSVIQDCHYDNFDGEEEEKSGYISLFHGNKPSYHVFKTKDDEINFVLESLTGLLDKGYNYEDIAICARTNDGLKDFRNSLHQQKIPYTDNSDNKNMIGNFIALRTFHKIKGLEFKHVFIVDVNERSVPKLPFNFSEMAPDKQENYLKNEKSLVYVAASRAIENISISGVGNKSEFINI